MAAFLDNCRFSPTTGGTADWTYSSAVAGSQSPAAAGAVNGRKYKFLAISADQSQWEIAEGAYNSATGVLARTSVLYNSSGTGIAGGQTGAGALIGFSAIPTVAIIGIKEDLISIEEANSFTAAQKAQGRANLDVLKKNYVINGGMQISQENGTTASSANNYYPVDFFLATYSNAGTVSAGQVSSPTPGGSSSRIRLTVTAADASVGAGDYYAIDTRIPAARAADLKFGTAGARTITVQFGCKGPAGTYGVLVMDGGFSRCYAAEYTIAAGEANTDVVRSVTIPGETSVGTWPKEGSGFGMLIRFAFMCGSTYQIAPNTWTSTVAVSTANQLNWLGTNGNVFELFDVSVTEGTVAPAFQLADYDSELALCKRYFQMRKASSTADHIGILQGISTTQAGGPLWNFEVEMNGAPTVTLSGNGDIGLSNSSGTFIACTGHTLTANTRSVKDVPTIGSASLTAGCATIAAFVSTSGWIKANARI